VLSFRELLKETVPWLWDEKVDKVFMKIRAG
jgi:hypothetical protein